MKQRVALGLSGGVDSAVSAAILKEQGYEVTGVFIICYRGPRCRTDEDRKDALDVALKLEIPFEVLDFRKAYQEKVLEYFKAEYAAGRTPNPDIVCNREIKFGLFYQWALRQAQGHRRFDYIATGHYARIGCSCQPDLDVLGCLKASARLHRFAKQYGQGCARQSRVCQLLCSRDEHKDQTYFLYQLRAEQLQHILFPIGGMTKTEVRREAEKRDLPVVAKPDSQGICFIGEVPIREFLKKMGIKEKVGEVVNMEGKVIGTHKGVWFYTIGQRHGFEIKVKSSKVPAYYVVGKDIQKNILVVGTKDQCMRQELEVGEVHWVNEDDRLQITDDREIQIRIRHQGKLVPSKIQHLGSKILVRLSEPAFGVAPGQSCVFYDGEVCLGGGIIHN